MDEGFDDIEMRNRNMEEEDRENEEEEETHFDDPVHDESIYLMNAENPDFNRVDVGMERRPEWERFRPPEIKKNDRILLNERKKFFQEIFKIRLEKKNGPNSSILLDNTEFV